jgi:AcrR family transcriptional regulator
MPDSAAAATSAAPKSRQPKKREPSAAKLQRNEETRRKLIEAAGKTIGKYGYAGCSIARVTARAKIAHGAFYLHFSSQQDLFDAVLPTLGASMLNIIGQAIQAPKDIVEVERRGVEANFERRGAAFQQHMDAMVGGYTRSLRRSRFSHYIEDYSDEELETIAIMLIGARTYLLMRYGVVDNAVKPLPPGKVEAYLKFVSHGLAGFGKKAPTAADGSVKLS